MREPTNKRKYTPIRLALLDPTTHKMRDYWGNISGQHSFIVSGSLAAYKLSPIDAAYLEPLCKLV